MPDFQENYTILTTPEQTVTEPQQFFQLGGLEQMIEQHGYKIYLDSMIECPCRGKDSKHLPSCKNCGGTGWSVVKRTETKAVLQSANLYTRFLEWSEEKLGTIRVTLKDQDRCKYMDRIIVLDVLSYSNEVIYPYWDSTLNKYIAFTNYWIQGISAIYFFKSKTEELVRLLEGPTADYTFTKNVIIFNSQFKDEFGEEEGNTHFSVLYGHFPQFHILDINREFLTQKAKDFALKNKQFPVSAVARRSHNVLDKQNYDDSYLLNNSTTDTIGYYEQGPNPDLTILSNSTC